jgi:acyl-CoA thioester hydrolase
MFEPSKDPRSSFSHLITVIESDLDELGHVNNAIYLRFMEDVARAHSEHIGMGVSVMKAHGVVPVVRKYNITYHRSALLNDALEVSTYTNATGVRAYRRFEVRFLDGRLAVEADTEWVWVDPIRMRPKNPPKPVLEAFGLA